MPYFDLVVSTAVRRHAQRYAAPTGLAIRIGDALESSMRVTHGVPVRIYAARRLTVLAASLLVAITVSSAATWYVAASDRDSGLAEQLLASHARSMLADHLTDVASSDQHTVKPWLGSRLDLSPPVIDLARRGFFLLGARLDYVDRRQVPALVYKRGFHIINLFVWPADESVLAVAIPASLRGYNLRRWADGGFVFCAVSDADTTQMDKFEQRFRAAMKSQTSELDRRQPPALYLDLTRRTVSPLGYRLHLMARLEDRE